MSFCSSSPFSCDCLQRSINIKNKNAPPPTIKNHVHPAQTATGMRAAKHNADKIVKKIRSFKNIFALPYIYYIGKNVKSQEICPCVKFGFCRKIEEFDCFCNFFEKM